MKNVNVYSMVLVVLLDLNTFSTTVTHLLHQ